MIQKMLSLAVATMMVCTGGFAQEFAEPSPAFSYKKTAYVYLESGDSVVGVLTKVGYKKALVDEIKIKKEGEKKAVEVDLNTIKNVYFPLANLGILASKLNVATDLNKLDKTGVNERLIKDGYVLYEKTATDLKGKTEILLLQLINPAFCDKIRVYADPVAAESQSYGFKGVTVAGGDELSYYVKSGDKTAFKLKRKDFKDYITELFGDCPALETRLKEDYKWTDLAKYVSEHATCGQ